MEEQQQYVFIDFEFTMPEGKANPVGFYPEIIEVGLVSSSPQPTGCALTLTGSTDNPGSTTDRYPGSTRPGCSSSAAA